MQQIELSQARQHLADLLNEALKGEEIVFTENNQPILRLTRITEPKPKHRLGQAAGKVWMADDFNETYSGFQLSEERWRKLDSLRYISRHSSLICKLLEGGAGCGEMK